MLLDTTTTVCLSDSLLSEGPMPFSCVGCILVPSVWAWEAGWNHRTWGEQYLQCEVTSSLRQARLSIVLPQCAIISEVPAEGGLWPLWCGKSRREARRDQVRCQLHIIPGFSFVLALLLSGCLSPHPQKKAWCWGTWSQETYPCLCACVRAEWINGPEALSWGVPRLDLVTHGASPSIAVLGL